MKKIYFFIYMVLTCTHCSLFTNSTNTINLVTEFADLETTLVQQSLLEKESTQYITGTISNLLKATSLLKQQYQTKPNLKMRQKLDQLENLILQLNDILQNFKTLIYFANKHFVQKDTFDNSFQNNSEKEGETNTSEQSAELQPSTQTEQYIAELQNVGQEQQQLLINQLITSINQINQAIININTPSLLDKWDRYKQIAQWILGTTTVITIIILGVYFGKKMYNVFWLPENEKLSLESIYQSSRKIFDNIHTVAESLEDLQIKYLKVKEKYRKLKDMASIKKKPEKNVKKQLRGLTKK